MFCLYFLICTVDCADGDFFRKCLISCPETVFDSNESNVCPRKPALHKTCPEPSASSVHYVFCQESPEYTVRLLGTDLRSQPSFSKGPINHMMLSEKDYSKQMLSPPDLSIQVSQKDLSSHWKYQQHNQCCASVSCLGEFVQQSKG